MCFRGLWCDAMKRHCMVHVFAAASSLVWCWCCRYCYDEVWFSTALCVAAAQNASFTTSRAEGHGTHGYAKNQHSGSMDKGSKHQRCNAVFNEVHVTAPTPLRCANHLAMALPSCHVHGWRIADESPTACTSLYPDRVMHAHERACVLQSSESYASKCN